MKPLNIFVAGITGQDGYYLSKKCFQKGHNVIGLSRKRNQKVKYSHKVIRTNYKETSLIKLIKKYKPDIIFNLASETNPKLSWVDLIKKQNSITIINLNFLNSIVKTNRKIRYFHASSSEIFGVSKKKSKECSNYSPNNPYGCFKLNAHIMVQIFREKYKLYLVNGILFNHESIKRGKDFLTSTIVRTARQIKKGERKKLILQTPYPIRDFAHAKDTVDAIYKIMNLKKARDFVISGGNIYSVKQIAEKIFSKFNISKKKIFFRTKLDKNNIKIGDTSRIRKYTNWKPKYMKDKFIDKLINE